MLKNDSRGIGCISIIIAGIVFWYGVIMLFVDIRTWVAWFAGVGAAALSVYPKLPSFKDGTLHKKALAAYIVGVGVAILVNMLLNVSVALLIVSSIVMLLVVPVTLSLVVEVLED